MAELRARRAIAEFGLIVAGVLVALVLESWWSDVGERRDEVRYLAALREELSDNRAGVEASLANRARADSSLTVAVRLLETGTYSDSSVTFILGLMNGAVYESIPLVTDAVFEDLNATGSFRLIRDDAVRRGIRRQYGRLSANWTRLARAQTGIDRSLAALVAEYLPRGTLRRPTPLNVVPVDPSADLSMVAQAIAADPMLTSEISLTSFALESEQAYLNEALGILEDYQVLLDSATSGGG